MAKVKRVVKRKVDVKMVEKLKVQEIVTQALEKEGYEVLDGVDYGFTKGTLVARGEKVDVQIKPITPKAGQDRYKEVEIVYE